jgi:hypothetical protein
LIRRLSGSRETAAQRALTDDELRKHGPQEAEEAEAAREAALDEWDALMYEAHDVTQQANSLAGRLFAGMAPLAELQEFLASNPASSNAYADLASLDGACMLLGLDSSTGAIQPAAVALYSEAILAGATTQEALQVAMVHPAALALWDADEDFNYQED